MALVRAKARALVSSRQTGFPPGPAVWHRLSPGQLPRIRDTGPRPFPEIARRNAAEARQRELALAAAAAKEASQRPRQPDPAPIPPEVPREPRRILSGGGVWVTLNDD
jgi:hypothetical protein